MIKTINGLSPQQFAQENCIKGEFGCSWYHGNWHLLKALGIVSTSAVHEQGITGLLKAALEGKTSPRILFTGSTDETLVRLTHDVCKGLGLEEKLFAVDICATPLAFMQSYANENNIKLTTYQSNILEFDAEYGFDIILTHAFMGYFDDFQRPLLIQKWKQLLSSSGQIVTIQRIRPQDSPKQVKFTSSQADQFIAAAIESAKQNTIDWAIDEKTAKTAAQIFADKFSNYAIRSRSDLELLFTNAGLAFQSLEYHYLEKKGELNGPSVPSNAEFAHIIVRNPGDNR